MVKKQFAYRGHSLEEMKAMDFSSFAELLPSVQRRKVKRGFTEQEKVLLQKIEMKKKNIETHCRDMIILPNMVGLQIRVYNGRTFENVRIENEFLGHRLGEFSLTRKKVQHNAPGVGATRSSANLSVK